MGGPDARHAVREAECQRELGGPARRRPACSGPRRDATRGGQTGARNLACGGWRARPGYGSGRQGHRVRPCRSVETGRTHQAAVEEGRVVGPGLSLSASRPHAARDRVRQSSGARGRSRFRSACVAERRHRGWIPWLRDGALWPRAEIVPGVRARLEHRARQPGWCGLFRSVETIELHARGDRRIALPSVLGNVSSRAERELGRRIEHRTEVRARRCTAAGSGA
jgi:hypothetical protein